MATVFDCPNCKTRLRVEGTLPENRQLRCRKCGATFSSNGVAKTIVDTPPNGAAYEVETPTPSVPPSVSPTQAPTLPSTPPPTPSVPDPMSPSQAPTLTSAPSSPKAPAPPLLPMGDLTGVELGGCRLEQKLGQGGMGAVYKAHHIALDIPVAVKVLPPYMAASHPRFIERFIREARAAARMQHQNIVGVTNVGEERGLHYIVMQYVDGETLQARIAACGRLSPSESVAIAMQLCEALAAAHSHGIIHRDIKPDNVMIDRFGLIRLADLGLAKDLDEDSRLTASGMGMGTPHYMPPEQAANAKNADRRSDIYSLGCTLFEMLTGKVPYDGESGFTIMTKHSNDAIPDAHELVPEIPVELAAIVRRMMAKKPEERPQSAEEVLADLRRVAPQCGSVAAPAPPRVPPTTPARRKRPILYGAIGLCALAVAGGATWYFMHGKERHKTPPASAATNTSVVTSPQASGSSAPPSTASSAARGAIRLDDWQPTLSSDTEPRRPLSFKELRHTLADGALTLRNEFADKRLSIVERKVRLDGDFDIEIEARGVTLCAIVDPRHAATNPLMSLRIAIAPLDPSDDAWHRISIRRRGGDVVCRVDDRDVPSRAFIGERLAQGYLSLTARPMAEMQVRNCVITPLSGSADAEGTPTTPSSAASGPQPGEQAPPGPGPRPLRQRPLRGEPPPMPPGPSKP